MMVYYLRRKFTMKFKLLYLLDSLKESGSRVALGLVFFVFGLNGFFSLFSSPTPAETAHGFLVGLATAPYFFPLLKGVELVCGALLLWGKYVTLALVALAPVVVNVVAFHAFLDPTGLVIALVVAVLYAHLLWQNRSKLSVLVEK